MVQVHTYQQVAILGATRYGCELAIQFANIGFPVYLYDVAAEGSDPSAVIKQNIQTLMRERSADRLSVQRSESTSDSHPSHSYQPEPLFVGSNYPHYILPKTYQHDSKQLYDCDLVLCASPDIPAKKQSLWFRLTPYFHPDVTLVSMTNTSGLQRLTDGLPERLRRALCACHWPLPLRYQSYLSISRFDQTPDTVLYRLQHFFSQVMGKTVIVTGDKPLNIIQDFVCFWLQLIDHVFGENTSNDFILTTYADDLLPAVLEHRYGAKLISNWMQVYEEKSGDSILSQVPKSSTTDDKIATFKTALSSYLQQRANTLDVSEISLKQFISHYFKTESSVLSVQSEINRNRDKQGPTKGISKVLPNLQVIKDAAYGSELIIHEHDDCELNTKQLQTLNTYCQKLLYKLGLEEEALVLRFHDYSPSKLPEKLIEKGNREKKWHDWFAAWNQLFRTLYSRSVPTILALSGDNSGFAAASAIYCPQVIALENSNLFPVCWHAGYYHPVPGYHFGLVERLTWQRGRIDQNEQNILSWDIPKHKSWGAANAKQKAWLPRHAVLVPNELHFNELVPLYKRMNRHMISWSANLPDYATMSDRHPWKSEFQHYAQQIKSGGISLK